MSKDIYAVLAEQLRGRRKAAKLSIEKLAELAGIGAGFLAHIETKQKKPSVATLGKIANALKIPVAKLFDDQPAPQAEADYRLALQLTHLLHNRTPAQKKAIVNTIKSMSRGFRGVKPKRG